MKQVLWRKQMPIRYYFPPPYPCQGPFNLKNIWDNKGLLYSTWNYIQYIVITHNGKEYEAVHLKLEQYCKSTIALI